MIFDAHVQKWQYLPGFWRQSLRNSNIYNAFLTFFDEDVQKWQYLQGFWRQSLSNSNIYNDFLTFLDEHVQKWQYLQGFWRQSLRNSNIYLDFFPQPWLLGSKLWLQGKGNLGVETLSPAGCMCGRPCSARVPGPVLGRVRKPYQHQHLQYTKGE